jgi:hypothetical protein
MAVISVMIQAPGICHCHIKPSWFDYGLCFLPEYSREDKNLLQILILYFVFKEKNSLGDNSPIIRER